MTHIKIHTTLLGLALPLSFFITTSFAEDLPSKEEMWTMIQQQQAQIKRLEAIVGVTNKALSKTTVRLEENEKKIEAAGDALDQISNSSGGKSRPPTSVGGYAELHFNGGRTDQIDLHRFVVFLSHEFSDKIRFFSELEIEHAVVENGQVGAVEMEQAYVEMDINENNRVGVGVQLIPIGILNETHEPPTFYGVERNNVEKNIIPATWWEPGVRLSGNLTESLSYDLMMHSGLDTTGQAYKIRSGRKKAAKAPWKNAAVTARVTWQAMTGVEIGATVQYQDDITQSSPADENAAATLFEIHTDLKRAVSKNGTFGFRALFAQWNIKAAQADLIGRNIQRGWYVEPSYKITIDDNNAVGVFARYSVWDNEAGDNIKSSFRQTTVGLNYWPHENVVLKLDYQIDNFDQQTSEDNRINLGIGLQF